MEFRFEQLNPAGWPACNAQYTVEDCRSNASHSERNRYSSWEAIPNETFERKGGECPFGERA